MINLNTVSKEDFRAAIFDVEADLFHIKCSVRALSYLCQSGQMDEPTSDAVFGLMQTIEEKQEAVVHRLYFGFHTESPFHNQGETK